MKKLPALFRLMKISLVVFCCLFSLFASAQSVWTGAVSTSWHDAANWSGNQVPTTSDDVIIPSSTPVANIDQTAEARNLTINGQVRAIGAVMLIINNVTINSGGLLNLGADSNVAQTLVQVGNQWRNNGGKASFRPGRGLIEFNRANNLNMTFSNGGEEGTFWGLSMLGENSQLVLQDSLVLTGRLKLYDGHIVSTLTNLMTLGENLADIVNGSFKSHIIGPVRVLTTANYNRFIPLGDGANYSPFGMSAVGTNPAAYLVSHRRTDPSLDGYTTTRIKSETEELCFVDFREYFSIRRLTSMPATVKPTLYYNGASFFRSESMGKVAYWDQDGASMSYRTLGGSVQTFNNQNINGFVVADLSITPPMTERALAFGYKSPLLAPVMLDDSSCTTLGQPALVGSSALNIRHTTMRFFDKQFDSNPIFVGPTFSGQTSRRDTVWAEIVLGNCVSPRGFFMVKPLPNPFVGQFPDSLIVCDTNYVVNLQPRNTFNPFKRQLAYIFKLQTEQQRRFGNYTEFEETDSTLSRTYKETTHIIIRTKDLRTGCLSDEQRQMVIYVRPKPQAPIPHDTISCAPANLTLRVDSTFKQGEYYRWFTSETGTDTLAGVQGSQYTSFFGQTTSYYVSKYVRGQGCESKRVEVKALIAGYPPKPVLRTVNPVCVGRSATISVVSPSDSIFLFADSLQTMLIAAGTGGSITTGAISLPTTYWVSLGNQYGCRSQATTAATINVSTTPAAPQVQDTTLCRATVVTLRAARPMAGGSLHWFRDSTGGTAIGTGDSLRTSIATTESFFVEYRNGTGCTSVRSKLTVNLIPFISQPTAAGVIACLGEPATLRAFGAQGNQQYRWYQDLTSTTPISLLDSLVVPNVTSTHIYYVALTEGGCQSNLLPVVVVVEPNLPQPRVQHDTVCTGQQAQLNAYADDALNYKLYDAQVGGNFVSQAADGRFNTSPLTADVTYYVSAVSRSGCESPRAAITAVIRNPDQPPVVKDTTICGGGIATLKASGLPATSNYVLFNAATGGFALQQNQDGRFTVPVTTTTTYYVAGVSDVSCYTPRVPLVVTVRPGLPAPTGATITRCGGGLTTLRVGNWQPGLRVIWSGGQQVIDTTLADSIQINISTDTTINAVLTDGNCKSAVANLVVQVQPAVVTPILPADTAICGTSTPLVLVARGANPGQVYNWYANATAQGFPILSDPTGRLPLTNAVVGTAYSVIISGGPACNSAPATIRILGQSPLAQPFDRAYNFCNPTAAQVVVSSSAGYPAGTQYLVYDTTTSTTPLFIANDSLITLPLTGSTRSFYISVSSADGCESPRARYQINISRSAAPTVLQPDTGCEGQSYNIVVASPVSAATYYLYDSPTSSTPVFQTNINAFSVNNLSTRTYYVAYDLNGAGCLSPRTAINVVIRPQPTAVVNIPSQLNYCSGASLIVLKVSGATGNAQYAWFNSNQPGTRPFVITSADSLIIQNPQPQVLYVALTGGGPCTGPLARVELLPTIGVQLPVARDTSVCQLGTVGLFARSQRPNVDYVWYDSPTSTQPLGISLNGRFNVTVSRQDTFYVAVRTRGQALFCESGRTRIIVGYSPLGLSPPTAGQGAGCANLPGRLVVTAPLFTNQYALYSGINDQTPLQTSTNGIFTITSAVARTFYASYSISGCESQRIPVQYGILPDAPRARFYSDTIKLCAGLTTAQLPLSVMPDTSATLYNFYRDTTQSAFASGTSPSVFVSITSFPAKFYVELIRPNSCRTYKVPVVITNNQTVMPAPQIIDTLACTGITNTIRIQNTYDYPAGTMFQFIQVTNGGNIQLQNSQLSSVNIVPNGDIQLRVQAFLQGVCQSPPVTISIRTKSSMVEFPYGGISDFAVCQNESAIIRLSTFSPDADYTVAFTSQPSVVVARAVNGVISLPVGNIAGTFNFVITGTRNGCQNFSVAQTFQVIVYRKPQPPVFTTTPQQVCPNSNVTVQVLSAPSGFNIRWYNRTNGTISQSRANFLNYVTVANDTLRAQYVSEIDGCSSLPTDANISLLPSAQIFNKDTVTCRGIIELQALTNARRPRTYEWYINGTLSGSDSTFRVVPNGFNVISLRVRGQDACPLTIKDFRVQSNTTISQPIDTTIAVCTDSNNVTIGTRVMNPSDTVFEWFSSPMATTALATTSSPRLFLPVARTADYYLSIRRGECSSRRARVSVIVGTVPPAPVVSSNSRLSVCDTSSLAQIFINNYANVGLLAYATDTGRTPIAVGSSGSILIKPTRLPFTVYLAQGTGCQSVRRVVSITENVKPFPPTGVDSVVLCGSSMYSFSLTPAPIQPVTVVGYRWFVQIGGQRVFNGTTLQADNTLGVNQVDTVLVIAVADNGCLSAPKKIAIKSGTPVTTPTLSNINTFRGTYCLGDSATFEIITVKPNVIYEWFENNVFRAAGPRLVLRNILTATVVSVRERVDQCVSGSLSIPIQVGTPSVITQVTQNTVCTSGTVTINFLTNGPGDIEIYDQPTGGTRLATISTRQFTTPVLTSTQVFYAIVLNPNLRCQPQTRFACTAVISPVVIARLANDTIVCTGNTFTINALNPLPAPLSGVWAVAGGSGQANLSFNTSTSTRLTASVGSYRIRYTILSQGNCPTTFDEIVVTFAGINNALVNASQTNFCSSDDVLLQVSNLSPGTYDWEDPSGNRLPNTGTSVNLGRLQPGLYTYRVRHVNLGCVSNWLNIPFTVNLNNVIINAGRDTATCSSLAVRLNATPVVGYTAFWTIISGRNGSLSNPYDPRAVLSGQQGETYELLWRAVGTPCNSPGDRVRVSIQSLAGPPTVLRNTYAVCNGEPITLSVSTTAVSRFKWYRRTAAGQLDSLTINQSGIYTVNPPTNITEVTTLRYAVSSVSGVCESAPVDITVTIYPRPSVSLGPDRFAPFNSRFDLTVSNQTPNMTYAWFVLEKPAQAVISVSNITTGTIPIPTDVYGVYRIRVRGVTPQGCEASDTITIQVADDLRIFNAFTPNRDGTNEVWNLANWRLYPDIQVIIYNKWNEVVYESRQGYETPWDGTRNGEQLPAGGYIYQIIRRPGEQPVTGTVTLIR